MSFEPNFVLVKNAMTALQLIFNFVVYYKQRAYLSKGELRVCSQKGVNR
jgi:hypothetical protein